MLNVAVLIGRLTRDRALRSTPTGQALASCTLAVDGPFANQQGERETDFVDVVCWRTLAETVTGHVGKGALVAVQGRAQVRSYETKDGQRRKATEVVADTVRFLEPKGVRAERGGAASEGIAGDNPGVRAMCPPEAEAAQTEPPADPPEESAGVSSVAPEIDLDACELDALPTFLDGNLDQLGPLADHCPRRAPPRARRSPERLRDALLARWAWGPAPTSAPT